jgi:hypothetical protein
MNMKCAQCGAAVDVQLNQSRGRLTTERLLMNRELTQEMYSTRVVCASCDPDHEWRSPTRKSDYISRSLAAKKAADTRRRNREAAENAEAMSVLHPIGKPASPKVRKAYEDEIQRQAAWVETQRKSEVRGWLLRLSNRS